VLYYCIVNKKIFFVILFLVVGVFIWWYSSKTDTPVTVLDSDATEALSFGWPKDVAEPINPKATISDFNVDLNNPVGPANVPNNPTKVVSSGTKGTATPSPVSNSVNNPTTEVITIVEPSTPNNPTKVVSSGPKPSASSFYIPGITNSVTPGTTTLVIPGSTTSTIPDSFKPGLITSGTTTKLIDSCALPTVLADCCLFSGVTRNECIASVALLYSDSSLCNYITGSVATTACINDISKPTKVIDRTLVTVPKATTTTIKTENTPTNTGTPVNTVVDPSTGVVTTYTTDGYGNITPTTYSADGSSNTSSTESGSGSSSWDALIKTTINNLPSNTSTFNNSVPSTGYLSDLTAESFNQRESEKTATLVSVATLSGPFLGHPGEIVLVTGEGFAKEGNILELKGEGLFAQNYKTKAAPSVDGRTFSTLLPFFMIPGVYSLSVSKENMPQTQGSGGGLKLEMIIF